MPPTAWSAKRKRQYEHIKESLEERGTKESEAEEIAARTVNKERAQHGEAEHPSRASLEAEPAPRRGGRHSHSGARGRTWKQLYEEARAKGLDGRSRMNKAQLEKALQR